MSRTHDVTISAFDLDHLEKELAAVTAQRDEAREQLDKLAEALRELRDAEWLTLPGRANDIVETALATLNQPEL